MSLNVDLYSALLLAGAQEALVDVLAVVRDSPCEPYDNLDLSTITPAKLIFAKSSGFQPTQSPILDDVMVGVGPDPNGFIVPTAQLEFTFEAPVVIDPTSNMPTQWVMDLWHLAFKAFNGTKTAVWSESPGSRSAGSTLSVKSIREFMSLSLPFNAVARGPGGDNAIQVNSLDVSNSLLNLNASLASTNITDVFVRPTVLSAFEDRGFTLVSLRDGILRPCLIRSLKLTFSAGNTASMAVTVAPMRVERVQQPDIAAEVPSLMLSASIAPPVRALESITCKVEDLSGGGVLFGLPTEQDQPWSSGFQTLQSPLHHVKSFSIEINNEIELAPAAHDPHGDETQQQFAWAGVATSRKVTGTLELSNPVTPLQQAERLARIGATAQGGIRIWIGETTYADFTSVAWSPAKSEGKTGEQQNRSLQWTWVPDTYATVPELQYES